MTTSFEYSDAKSLSPSVTHAPVSPEEQEREDYLNEVSRQSTQFGCGRFQYEPTFDFNAA